MEKPKPKKPQTSKMPKGKSTTRAEEPQEEGFDFGGFPSGVDLKKNMGCGG